MQMLEAQIELIMKKVEAPAVLAMRPYPPVDLPETWSQLGGLPILPAETDWPRASDGTPLHFLARIDCSELPEPRGALPDSGILQFFARLDEEMIWEGQAFDYSRVLHSATRAGRAVSPPADLPPIQGGQYSYDRGMRLPDEPQTRIYPSWPLTFKNIRTWPTEPSIDPRSGVTLAAYWEAADRASAAEIVRTTGRPTNPLMQARWGEYEFNREGKRIVVLPQAARVPEKPPAALLSDRKFQTAEFPQAWIMVERIARAMACLAGERIGRLRKTLQAGKKPTEDLDPEKLLTDLEHVTRQSLSWVGRAQSAGLDAAISEAEAKEYKDWLTHLAGDDRFEMTDVLSRGLKRGMSYAIKYCGGSRKAAALVPVAYMNRLEGEHAMISADIFAIEIAVPRWRINTTHHQLLGHAPTSQDIGVRTAKDILLLHLVSDTGVDFMFCDCGEIQFWINAKDLAAKRFDRVSANMQGG